MRIETVRPGLFGIFNAAGCRLVDTSYGLMWACVPWYGRALIFKSVEEAEQYAAAIFSPPPAPEYVI